MTGPGYPPVVRRVVLSHRDGRSRLAGDILADEVYLRVDCGGTLLATLACTPCDLADLATGFVLTLGIGWPGSLGLGAGVVVAPVEAGVFTATLDAPPELSGILREGLPLWRQVPSGCGVAPVWSAPVSAEAAAGGPTWPGAGLGPDEIADLSRQLAQSTPVFAATGGVHGAALAGPGPDGWSTLVTREDIGRHNAVDKIAGWSWHNAVAADDKALLVTGRVSADLVAKCTAMGVPVLISRSAPTHRAVEAADAAGLTVVGFARGGRFNVYANWWRLHGLEPVEREP